MAMSLNNKNVLVLGLGETGLSALRWLAAQGAVVGVADTRDNPPNLDAVKREWPAVKLYLGPLDADVLCNVNLIVLSPGMALSEPAIQAAINAGVPVVGDVELFAQYRSKDSKVIAITGNIGLPVLDALQMETPDVYVLELSSFQLETTVSLDADVATVLNLTEDHMDRYADMTAYAAAKAHIFYQAKHQVLNRDDAWSMIMERPGLELTTFGLDQDDTGFGIADVDQNMWLCEGDQHVMNVADLHIKGAHNAANALAALALCRAIGLEYAPLLNALYNFKGLPHRVEWVAQIDDVDYYNDSKGTNVGATCAAMSGLPQPVVLIAGGDGKGQDFSPLRAPVADNGRAVVLIGQDAKLMEAELLSTEVPMYHASDMHEAVVIAKRVAQSGDAILLSPACASLDMYSNYISRAEAFVDAVNGLGEVVC